jgi:hypothetical protein
MTDEATTPANAGDVAVIVGMAREAADDLLERYYRVGVRKALDLGNPRDFDGAVAKLAALLRARARSSDDAAVRAAVGVLDVDWAATTARQRRTLIMRALDAAGRKTAGVPRAVQAVFGDAASEVVAATRRAARRDQKLTIAADFNALDRRIIRHLTTSQANFVSDEYGRRHEAFAEEARRIVAHGLESGLGRDDLARDLERAARGTMAGHSSVYWEAIAGAFVSRGRSFAQLSAYAEARIERYLIEAVLDERTTEICRFLHGKSFSVSSGLQTFEEVESSPGAIKELTPWVREAITDAGRKALYIERGGQRVAIAEVSRSGLGTRDDRGEFARGRTERELMDLGVSFPPYHALCRTSTVADVS